MIRAKKSDAGFTLVELLTVLAVISVLVTVTTPALSSLLQANKTSLAADLTTSAGMRARQMAITDHSPVALVLTPATADNTSNQSVLLLISNRDAEGNYQWSAGSKWQPLPQGVHVNISSRAGVESFYNESTPSGVLTGNLPVQLKGAPVSAYGYIVFYPDGTIDAPTTGPMVTVTGLKVSAVPDYTLIFQSDFGSAKLISN